MMVADLCCGLGGWTKGFIAEGWECYGFDIERHEYGSKHYPAQLVLQDILTIQGSQFKDFDAIVASPPCQEFSYIAMPWHRAKAIGRGLRGEGTFPEDYTGSRTVEQMNALFNACFRIQREASEAAGRHIPMVVENVKGAQPWVGKAQANFGSYYLWGDIANVGGRIVRPHEIRFGMPSVKAVRRLKQPGRNFHFPEKYGIPSPIFHGGEHEESVKAALALQGAHKNGGNGSWFSIGSPGQTQTNGNPVNGVKVASDEGRRTDPGKGARFTSRDCGVEAEGVKQRGSGREWFAGEGTIGRTTSSNSPARKAASAMIAEIPYDLALHVARCMKP